MHAQSHSEGIHASHHNPADTASSEDPCIFPDDFRYCWTLDPITGTVRPAVPDTSYIGMGNAGTMENQALAIAYTGNLWSPHQSEDYFARPRNHDFLFVNSYNLFATSPDEMRYYNTRIPFTMASYRVSGGSMQANDHLKLNFAGNFNKEIGLGSALDYVYARGEYQNSATKPLKWLSYFYYTGERYKAYLSLNVSKYANQENGGILDRGYVLDPDSYNDNFTEPTNMPTQLVDTWNDTDHRNIHFTHNYDLGFWREVTEEGDTAVYDEFVPVANLFHTIDFDSYEHSFRMDANADATDDGFFQHHYINPTITNDSIEYRNFSTYAGIRLNEGFSKYSQFGIAAFIGYERQHYTMMYDTLAPTFISRRHVSNNVWLGGQLSRHQTSALTFDITARTAVSGDKVGDVDINGSIQTVIPFGKRDEAGNRTDSLLIQASGHMRNTRVSYLMDHYFSNHFKWSNDFDREQSIRVEGSITYPKSKTTISAGIEHINNYHYFDATDGLPHQFAKQLDIFSLKIRQGLKAGILHWDNAILVQTTTDEKVLPLPAFSIETDLSIRFRIAKTLLTQLGATGYYHTKYYAPAYQPATQTWAVQDDIKCGNFPVVNAYVNCHLKRIKFFVMMHNILHGSVTNDVFIGPNYPMMPRRFEWGVVLDFQN